MLPSTQALCRLYCIPATAVTATSPISVNFSAEICCLLTQLISRVRNRISISLDNMPTELLSGLVPLHILHHASQTEIYGQWMIEELRHHGYRIGPGTLYPMLHRLEERGYLRVREERSGRTMRRYYRATAKGKAAVATARHHVAELFGEMAETDRKRPRKRS